MATRYLSSLPTPLPTEEARVLANAINSFGDGGPVATVEDIGMFAVDYAITCGHRALATTYGNDEFRETLRGVIKSLEAATESVDWVGETHRLSHLSLKREAITRVANELALEVQEIALSEPLPEDLRGIPVYRLSGRDSVEGSEVLILTDQSPATELPLREFDAGDWNGWAGTEKPRGFEPQIAEINVEGLPPKKIRERGRPITVYFNPGATLIVDANGITINFFDRYDQGWTCAIHKPIKDFPLAVEVAKALRPTMTWAVLNAIGFEVD